MSSILQVSHEDWIRIAEKLFGKDVTRWRFTCVACGHEMSIEEAEKRNPEMTDFNWMGSSCEGRHNKDVGCDWALGGLFQIHTLEVFINGVLRPSFRFAHPEADPLLEEASARYTPPRHLESSAERWEDFVWPDWVPTEVREAIQSFWGPRNHRTLKDWLANMRDRKAPVFGENVSLRRLGATGDLAHGRYVHAWNNIGRLITPDGTVEYVSF